VSLPATLQGPATPAASPDAERRLRLAFVCNDYPFFEEGQSGGIGMHTYALANAVASLGHDVSVIAGAKSRTVVDHKGTKLHGVPVGTRQLKLGRLLPVSWLRWSFTADREVRRLHRSNPFDLVVFPDAYGEGYRFALSPVAPFVVRFGGPATVNHKWDGRQSPPVRARVEFHVESLPARRASLTVCSSRSFAEFVSKEWGLDFDRFRFVRNPLDIVRFRPAEVPAVEAKPVVLFAGRVQPLKGAGDLAAAIPAVLRAVPNARFMIIGHDTKTAPDGTSFRAYLEKDLRNAGASDRVEWVKGIPQDELIPLYQRCAVFVLPCRNDVYPNSTLEAMGCGAPCIVTSTTGTSELVTRADAGRVVPPADTPALAAAIVELLKLPAEARVAMGGRARRVVESLCAPSVIGANAVNVYREAIARGRRGRPVAAARAS
jgi:glycosyltransferase involved in cell wall biosynthesis